MKKQIIALSLAIVMSFQCLSADAQPKAKNQKWFDAKEWLCGIDATPAASIDVDAFAEHYAKHPKRWQTVFDFIKEHDLSELKLGKSVLSDEVNINVQEYKTRPKVGNKQNFEKHCKYIDVQYTITGEELHGTTKMENAKVFREYNPKNDMATYQAVNAPFYTVKANQFSIFFPEDVHIAHYSVEGETTVKKIVFKVLVD